MVTKAQEKISGSVSEAAGKAVSQRGYATAIDVFIGLGWLSQKDLLSWKRGEIPFLERVVTANLSRISRAMKEFRVWAVKAQLKPSTTVYKHKSHTLRFSKSGHEGIEAAYRTHFVLPKRSVLKDPIAADKNGKKCLLPFADNVSTTMPCSRAREIANEPIRT